jgi:guanosine-3',5'-bis(diphosphate) 3'-pyrophosphohydrolase
VTKNPPGDVRVVLEAASFAARAHRHQLRKDAQTPYVAHAFRVCLIVRHVFGIDDTEFLTAVLLHDTIEDTTTDFDDLEERFGQRVASWVAKLSKDMRLPEAEREESYTATLATEEPAVKIAKLADIFDNLIDSQHLSPSGRRRTVDRSRQYLAALESNLPALAERPMALVRELLASIASTESAGTH